MKEDGGMVTVQGVKDQGPSDVESRDSATSRASLCICASHSGAFILSLSSSRLECVSLMLGRIKECAVVRAIHVVNDCTTKQSCYTDSGGKRKHGNQSPVRAIMVNKSVKIVPDAKDVS